jgi:hypothetical protein
MTPHACVPGTNIDDSTRQISLSHDDFDAQTDDFGSPPKKFKKPFPVPPSSSKEPSSHTFKRRARPNARRRRAARRRQPDSRVDMAGPGVVSMVSDMISSRCAEETQSLECSSTSAPPGSSLSCRGDGFLRTSSYYLRGIPARTTWSHNEGCRLKRGVAHPRSVRNDFPGPVGLDGYG